MATVKVAIDTIRSLLGDDSRTLWSDQVLLPKIADAHRELILRLARTGAQVLNTVSVVLSVPAFTTPGINQDLSTVVNYPVDMVEPVWLKERAVGQLDSDFVDMNEVDFLPNMQRGVQLIWWTWQQEKVFLLGSTVANEVQLRYRRFIASPTQVTDSIGVAYGELFIARKVASDCTRIASNKTLWSSQAESHFNTIKGLVVKKMQNLPAKRRPYHRGRGRSRVIRDF